VEFPKPKEPEPVVWILRDVNYSDLRQIRGISAKIARRIRQVVLRTVFKDWKDLEKRTRIKPKGLAALMQHVKTKMPKPPEPKDIRYKWHCVVCKVDWCARCKIKWHDGETCLDIKLKDKFKESELGTFGFFRVTDYTAKWPLNKYDPIFFNKYDRIFSAILSLA